jgi:protease-4
MNGKRWAALILAIGLFFVSVVYQFSLNSTNTWEQLVSDEVSIDEKVIQEGGPDHKIAILHLEGVIQDIGSLPFSSPLVYDHQQFLKSIEYAGADDSVDGIILHVNTPGGGVVESAEIHAKLVEVREKYNKPLYVSMGNTAASGGYYVAAPADKIVAHPATLTGSIGVIMESVNFAELADKLGVDFNTIKSGEFKDILSSSRTMTEEEEVILQTMIDELFDDFVQVIVDGRGMSEDEVRTLADGRIYTGKQAKENGLIDEVGSLEDTIALMETEQQLENAHVVQYEVSYGILGLLNYSAQTLFSKDSELEGIMHVIRDSSGPRAMYLYSR